MINSEKGRKYTFALCVSFTALFIRWAIRHELAISLSAVTLAKYLTVAMVILVVCNHAVELFAATRKMYRLPGPKVIHGLRLMTSFYTSLSAIHLSPEDVSRPSPMANLMMG